MEQSDIDKRIEKRMERARWERNIATSKMVLRFVRMFVYRAVKGRWHLPAVSEISIDELHSRIDEDPPPVLIDVRSPQEFNDLFGHIPDSRSIPITQLNANLEDLQAFKGHELVTICPGGGMSLVAAEILAEAGFKDVKSLKGGIDQWFKKGYPTTLS